MEGPTPVSALIHAATMVTAGVYLLCRMNPILGLSSDGRWVIAIIGCATAFVAATIASSQHDIKKVLAFSTVSQIGYMVLAVGCGAYIAALFLMVCHAFYKGLLFLAAGSVIHGLEDEQELARMGALRKWLPWTFATFLVGWLAIAASRRWRASGPRATCSPTSMPSPSRSMWPASSPPSSRPIT